MEPNFAVARGRRCRPLAPGEQIDALKDAEKKAGAAPSAEPAPFTAADEEVMATFIARRRQSWEEELQQKSTEPGHCANDDEPR